MTQMLGVSTRLLEIKAELFNTNLKNIDTLRSVLDKHFVWCDHFSNVEGMTKSEKLSFYELTVLLNQSVQHSQRLQEAVEECRESSIYWEDYFQCISDHYHEYNNDYIQYMEKLVDLQNTMQKLHKHESIAPVLLKIQLECCNQSLDMILVYPKERMIQIQKITNMAQRVLSEKADVKALSIGEKVELESCLLVQKVLDQILSPTENNDKSTVPRGQKNKTKSRHLCKAIYKFNPTRDDELKLKVGDIIEILAEGADDWWQGRLKDKIGLFPSNHVKVIPSEMISSEEESSEYGQSSEESDDSGNYDQVSNRIQSIQLQENPTKVNKEGQVEPSNSAQSSTSNLSHLQAQLLSADESKTKAEAELQELIQKAEIAKAEAEAKAKVLRQILSSSGAESSASSGPGKGSKGNPKYVPKKNSTKSEADKDNKVISKTNEDLEVDKISKELDKLDTARKQDVVYKVVECGVCKKSIERFVSKEGIRYCGPCYEDKFAVKCVKCTKSITADGLTFKTLSYHPDCFKCNHCQNLIAKEAFTSHDDQPYCYPCYGELYSKRCTACTLPITNATESRFIRTNELYWHSSCFVCVKCKEGLAGREYVSPGSDNPTKENIFCPECA